MIKSLTGYGTAKCDFEDKTINIEIKSLNNRNLDILTRIPQFYRSKDLEIRSLISQFLYRGKIEFVLSVEMNKDLNAGRINKAVVKDYFSQINEVAKELDLEINQEVIATILRMPDVIFAEKEELTKSEWDTIQNSIISAINELDQFREQEGQALEEDIVIRINAIQKYIREIADLEPKRIEKIKERIDKNFSEQFDYESIDQNRYEQEIIYYLEKLDITEERVRLLNHCKHFLETIQHTESSGKKLTFISQEIGREVNTIGAKANDIDIQRVVVEMKDELEKIKEQLMNVL